MVMQMQASQLTKEKTDYAAKVESLVAQMKSLQSGAGATAAATAAQEAELSKLRTTVAELHGSLESAKVWRFRTNDSHTP
jgi:peptidoglycan hydrolase CwlO-like protein